MVTFRAGAGSVPGDGNAGWRLARHRRVAHGGFGIEVGRAFENLRRGRRRALRRDGDFGRTGQLQILARENEVEPGRTARDLRFAHSCAQDARCARCSDGAGPVESRHPLAVGQRQAIDPVGAALRERLFVAQHHRLAAAGGNRIDAQLEVVADRLFGQRRIHPRARDLFEHRLATRLRHRHRLAHDAVEIHRHARDFLAVGERKLQFTLKHACVRIEEGEFDRGLRQPAGDAGGDGDTVEPQRNLRVARHQARRRRFDGDGRPGFGRRQHRRLRRDLAGRQSQHAGQQERQAPQERGWFHWKSFPAWLGAGKAARPLFAMNAGRKGKGLSQIR